MSNNFYWAKRLIFFQIILLKIILYSMLVFGKYAFLPGVVLPKAWVELVVVFGGGDILLCTFLYAMIRGYCDRL